MFPFYHFCKYSFKIKILVGQKLYTNWLKESFSTFCFLDRPEKGGNTLDFQKGGNLRKGGLIQKRGSMNPFTNYTQLLCKWTCLRFLIKPQEGEYNSTSLHFCKLQQQVFFNQISCNKDSKAKISCFFLWFFSV